MAVELTLYSSVEGGGTELQQRLADLLDGELTEHDYLQRPGLQVSVWPVEPGEEAARAAKLGFTHRSTVMFRLSNRATEQVTDENLRRCVGAAIAVLESLDAGGTLLFVDTPVLERLQGVLALAAGWEGWDEVPGLREQVAGHLFAVLEDV